MVRFSCEKALVQQAVAAVSRAVAAKSSIPALEGILLECGEGLRLSGYNMQTGIRTTVEAAVSEAGHIVLNARLFGEMIRRLPDDMVSDVSVAQVLTRYFVEVDEPLLQFGPLTITLKPLIAVTLLGFALCLAVLALRKKPLAVLAGSALVWVLNLAAPVSWMVLSKAHAYVHVHLVPMLWHFALVPVSCALLVWLVKTAITAVKE